MIVYRDATMEDLSELENLLWKHGNNDWSHLTRNGVRSELLLIQNCRATAKVALWDSKIIGFAAVIDGSYSPLHLAKYGKASEFSLINGVVVDEKFGGRGIATHLLNQCLVHAENASVMNVLVEIHQEHATYAGILRKVGFVVIDEYEDLERWATGSRTTTILQRSLAHNDKHSTQKAAFKRY
ncbi:MULTISPECIES: GNAT family N-acetyltransferase [Vibrio]|uniref:GNAT family N-acetyltransferase n=1 Tax=Vibrio TaxID=662 RepID=UPI0006828A5A|nr:MULTISPECIES: GNAT family N-acetyltransferase [Vibrio]MDE3898434.1 GNAT family N-acetyltransferase [Vibrio sp. CC007]